MNIQLTDTQSGENLYPISYGDNIYVNYPDSSHTQTLQSIIDTIAQYEGGSSGSGTSVYPPAPTDITLTTTLAPYVTIGSTTCRIKLPDSDPYTSPRTPEDHTHGSITSSGTITSVTNIDDGDYIVIAQDSTGSIKKSNISFDTSDTTNFLRADGTWSTPPSGGTTVTLPSGYSASTGITLSSSALTTIATIGGTELKLKAPASGSGSSNPYPTAMSWNGGTSSGPIASITMSDTNYSFNSDAIPYASGTASGIITTDAQTLAGVKTFSSSPKLSTNTITTSSGYVQTFPNATGTIVNGTGTSGYLAKWNGTNKITNGPAFGSSTTTFLRNDGTWATPSGSGGTTVTLPSGYSASTGITLNSSSLTTIATIGGTALNLKAPAGGSSYNYVDATCTIEQNFIVYSAVVDSGIGVVNIYIDGSDEIIAALNHGCTLSVDLNLQTSNTDAYLILRNYSGTDISFGMDFLATSWGQSFYRVDEVLDTTAHLDSALNGVISIYKISQFDSSFTMISWIGDFQEV